MSRIDTASLERIKADFEKAIPGVPALYHLLIVGATSPIDPTHLRQIVPDCVNIAGNHEGVFLNENPPSWCRGYFFTMRATDGGPELMQRFDTLAKATLPAIGWANAPSHAWLAEVYRTAWSSNGGSTLRADKFRVFATPNSPIDHCHFVPVDESPPEGMQLLFPHEYYCVLEPDVFAGSVKAIEAMLAEAGTLNGKRSVSQLDAESRALAVLTKHPDWTMARIADEAGVSRASLYRFPRFIEARHVTTQHARAGYRDCQQKRGG